MIDVEDVETDDDHAPPYGARWVVWIGWRQRVCRRCGAESERQLAQLPADARVAWLNGLHDAALAVQGRSDDVSEAKGAPMPATVELCARPRELGQPCRGLIYRPQPETIYCAACGGKEPGVVYELKSEARAAFLKAARDLGYLGTREVHMGGLSYDVGPRPPDIVNAFNVALGRVIANQGKE